MTNPGIQRTSRNGRSACELADRLGVTPQTIRKSTAEPRGVYEARAAERHERIQELRNNGLSKRAIAAELNISVGTVHYALHKAA